MFVYMYDKLCNQRNSFFFISTDIFIGAITSLAFERRGKQVDSKNIDNNRVLLQFKFPLNEIVVDFYDSLKSISSGYASFDYEESGFETSNVVKVNVTNWKFVFLFKVIFIF